MRKILDKLFGGLKMSWTAVIIFAVIMGLYTALMAMLVPDGNSFHDIAVTPEWWVLPAIIIIVNCKTPLDAALKTFVFFLISQPLVYLIQVPFNSMGWGLFQYYPYWFKITLATFPGAFIGWYIKKDEWYSGVILSAMTALLAYFAMNYIIGFQDSFPNHLITVIYCFATIILLIFGVFKKWLPRVIAALVSIVVIVVFIVIGMGRKPFEAYRNGFLSEYEIVFVGEPYISSWSGSDRGSVEINNFAPGEYMFRLMEYEVATYYFTVSDDSETEYNFTYGYDSELQTVVVEKK